MGNNDDQADINPFVRALRGNKPIDDEVENDEGQYQNGNRSEVIEATMEAMSMEDTPAETVANEFVEVEAEAVPNRAAAVGDGGRMEAVVDLLFGNHLNEINASMRSLEKQISERVNKMESEMRVRIESIDRHTKGEIDSLSKVIEKERATQNDNSAKMSDRVETAVQQMEMRLEKMEGEFTRNYDMAQKDLNERLTKAADATMLIRKNMEQEVANMKVSLSTRAELGTMFAELGKRLEANASGGGL